MSVNQLKASLNASQLVKKASQLVKASLNASQLVKSLQRTMEVM